MNKKLILTGFAIFISFIFLMAPIGAASHSISPALSTSTSTNYQPNPNLNTNVTWSTFHNGWSPLEYTVNTTSNATLNANYSQFYANPISVNPGDIVSGFSNYTHEMTTSSTNMKWNPINIAGENAEANGEPASFTDSNTSGIISFSYNSNTTSIQEYGMGICVDTSSLPSANLQYDYFSSIIEISSGTPETGLTLTTGFNSAHANRTETIIGGTSTIGETYFSSVPLSKYAADIGYTTSSTNYPRYDIVLTTPVTTSVETYTVKILDFGITESSSPMSLGTRIVNGTTSDVTNATGNAQLNSFSPNFAWTSIIDNGYSVAVSQTLQNETTTQTALASGNYIEQVGYNGIFQLPSAPDLSYSTSNVTLPLSVPADQFQVLDISGASYLSSIGNKTNGTVTLISSANPTAVNSYLAYVDYTASQWQSISHPAGIFTYDGIAYYYFIAIGAIAGIIGLAVPAKRANTKAKQEEKVDHTIRRGR